MPHNPKVAGSNPAPAIETPAKRELFSCFGLVRKWASNTLAVRRAIVGAVLREQSGCKELPSRERVIADLRVLMNEVPDPAWRIPGPGSGDSGLFPGRDVHSCPRRYAWTPARAWLVSSESGSFTGLPESSRQCCWFVIGAVRGPDLRSRRRSLLDRTDRAPRADVAIVWSPKDPLASERTNRKTTRR
jgi:hypothetical protein